MIKQNLKLSNLSINLGCNDITDNGFISILEAIKWNRTIHKVKLNFRYTEITSKSVLKINELITTAFQIQYLTLWLSETFLTKHDEA